MRLEILTPKGREFEEDISVLILPTLSGEISILPNHCPLISVLKPGRIKIRIKEKEIEKEIEGGIFLIKQNKCSLLLKKF